MSAPGRIDLSIIVPSKNCAAYLPTGLASLMQQGLDLQRVQFVFIDDGSDDATGERYAEFAQHLEHVEIITNATSRGLADGRNQGIDAACGEYITFLDGDDWYAPGHLAEMLAAIEHLGVDFVRCDHVQVTGKERRRHRAPMALRNTPLPARAGILPVDDSTLVDYPFAWAGLYHRRLADIGLLRFPTGFLTAEDRPWIWNLHLNGGTCAVLDAPGVCYRRGLDQSLSQVLDERQLYFIPAFEQIFELLAVDPERERLLPKAVRNWLAILEHQSQRFDTASWSIRRQITERARTLSDSLPWDVLKQEFLFSRPSRRTAILQMMPRRAELLSELTL